MTVQEIVADVLIVVGFALGAYALGRVSVTLALGVVGLVLFAAGVVLTVRPRPPRSDAGPFEAGS